MDTSAAIAARPLRRVERALPEPEAGQIGVAASSCGVCRTDLHLAEGTCRPSAPG